MNHQNLTVGNKAPLFTLFNHQGEKISLSSFKGQWVVLYFYPKDNTPGCTVEAIEFTAAAPAFAKLNAVILGVSPDSPKSHCSFIEKQKLGISLLSDPDHVALESYGAWQLKKNYGKDYMGVVRSTFLIDPQGKIAHVWPKVSVKGHVEEVRRVLKEQLK